jgi:hypothetical protein
MNRRHCSLLVLGLLATWFCVGGCGSDVLQELELPDRLIGVDGQVFTVEDLEAISDDSSLSADQKRQAFRDLGIEDPDLIEALLNL